MLKEGLWGEDLGFHLENLLAHVSGMRTCEAFEGSDRVHSNEGHSWALVHVHSIRSYWSSACQDVPPFSLLS